MGLGAEGIVVNYCWGEGDSGWAVCVKVPRVG